MQSFYDLQHATVFYKLNNVVTNQITLKNTNNELLNYYSIKTNHNQQIVKLLKTFQSKIVFLIDSKNQLNSSSLTLKQSLNSLLHLDCHFLKKEKLYTKRKYSRSPQYDIVSGGVAALMSAFIGFLISEKFGIELVDSGDFYTLFMYVVFLVFSLRPLVKITTKFDKLTPIFSLLPLINLLNILFKFIYVSFVEIINNIKSFFKIY
jgi:hypothetical protein